MLLLSNPSAAPSKSNCNKLSGSPSCTSLELGFLVYSVLLSLGWIKTDLKKKKSLNNQALCQACLSSYSFRLDSTTFNCLKVARPSPILSMLAERSPSFLSLKETSKVLSGVNALRLHVLKYCLQSDFPHMHHPVQLLEPDTQGLPCNPMGS